MASCDFASQPDRDVLLQASLPEAQTNPAQFGSALYGSIKAISDCAIALLLFVLTAPLIALAAILVKLNSRGPVFYSQVRLGRGGKPFRIYKIRTMTHDCEKDSGAKWSTPGDARVTRVGRFLRKSHLDELPQLWNVLRGDMSLVGPRPERPEFVPTLEKSLARYRERLLVRPGVSGLAQVQLPPDTDLDSVRRKLAYDLCYVERMSFWLDLRILFCTGLRVLGLPYSLSARCFKLPGGNGVELQYQESVRLNVECEPTLPPHAAVSSPHFIHPDKVRANEDITVLSTDSQLVEVAQHTHVMDLQSA